MTCPALNIRATDEVFAAGGALALPILADLTCTCVVVKLLAFAVPAPKVWLYAEVATLAAPLADPREVEFGAVIVFVVTTNVIGETTLCMFPASCMKAGPSGVKIADWRAMAA